MMSFLINLGVGVRDAILGVAGQLTQEYFPGLIAFLLVLVLLVCTGRYLWQIHHRIRALRWLIGIIDSYATPQSFTAGVIDIDPQIDARKHQKQHRTLVAAWQEYRETLVPYGEGEAQHLRNSVRPSTFFNQEDLGYGPGFWRIVPGLFVTGGLFLTFLGLIAALSVMDVGSGDPDDLRRSLDNLLTTASAKFIMSLTGLFCSIVFTIVLRIGLGWVEQQIHTLCSRVEFLLQFISAEDIAVDQLRATQEQKEHFRSIGMELVAELGRPLREELPKTIATSVANALQPMVERVTNAGTEGVSTMASDLANKFSTDVATALANASTSIEGAGIKIGELAARMDQSSDSMNQQLLASIASLATTLDNIRTNTETSAARTGEVFQQGADKLIASMTSTLEDIRDNTARGADAVKEAATEMRGAAEAFRSEVANAAEAGARHVEDQMKTSGDAASGAVAAAGEQVLGTFGATAERITAASNDMAERLAKDLLTPLDGIGAKFETLNRELSGGVTEFRRLADGIKTGADSTVVAANTFRNASQDMASAAAPIRTSVEGLGGAVQRLETSTRQTAESMASTMRSAHDALESASAILSDKRQAIQHALAGVQQLTEGLRGQGERLDDLDEKLGKAFEQYERQVSGSLHALRDHVGKLQDTLTPALDKLREIVEQAETFVPQSRARR
ncbi:MAG: methyl-accepting chemotaxis protein [Alphaproteobacteria bacterium]|nr:methyl-accepting chemotaxis protein [Alphaproteobacteria bacterium]MCB9931733.1 methyl-accepting chemotaxis protein [Alphaproteobacteria bacterium]